MWKWVKVPKGIALLAFVLPWMTVSCSGQPIVKAAGWQLAFGSFTASLPNNNGMGMGPGMGMQAGPQTSHDINVWLIVAMVLIAAGLAIACLKASKQMSLVVLGTSAASLVLIWIGTQRYSQSSILAEAAKAGAGSGDTGEQFGRNAMAAMIQVSWEIGFWLAVLGLIAAGVLAWLSFKDGETAEAGEPPA